MAHCRVLGKVVAVVAALAAVVSACFIDLGLNIIICRGVKYINPQIKVGQTGNTGKSNRVAKETVDRLCDELKEEISQTVRTAEAAHQLGISYATLLSLMGKVESRETKIGGRVYVSDLEKVRLLLRSSVKTRTDLYGVEQIATRLNCSTWHVSRLLREEGVLSVGGKFTGMYPKGPVDAIIQKRSEEQEKRSGYLGVRDAADIIGCYHKAVRTVMRAHGYDAAFRNAYVSEQVYEVARLRKERHATKRTQAETVRT